MLKSRSISRLARPLLGVAVTILLAGAHAAMASNTTIHAFSGGGTDGANPLGGLTLDAAGNLYGTTANGGSGTCPNGCGTVYRLSLSSGGWIESVIYNFLGSAGHDGSQPVGPLTVDASGNLYGYTFGGGPTNSGVVYQLSPGQNGSWSETVLHSFGSIRSDGGFPTGKLVFDPSGNLWGVTEQGGKAGSGTVFELLPSSSGWQYSLVYSFPYGASSFGTEPSGIIFDNNGNLYGVTTFGGILCCNGAGVVFQLVNSGGVWTQNVLHRFPVFNTKRLQTPTGGLFLDSSTGTLYMTMARGGNGNTGVTTINLTTLVTTDLYSFKGPQILEPYQAITFDSTGNLLSSSYYSGVENSNTCFSTCGFVFELSPGSPRWTSRILESFTGSNGMNPPGGVVDNSGSLYGVTTYGGANNLGVVFEITP